MPVDTDRDVFKKFMAGAPSKEIALLAFASYAAAKYDWEDHHEKRHGKAPTAAEVENWIKGQSDNRLDESLKQAAGYCDEAATSYMEDEIKAQREEAINQSVLTEVVLIRSNIESLTSFRVMFWPNLFNCIVASFAFAVIIIVASLIFNKDPSPFSFFKTKEVTSTGAATQPPSPPATPSPSPPATPSPSPPATPSPSPPATPSPSPPATPSPSPPATPSPSPPATPSPSPSVSPPAGTKPNG